MLNLNIALSSPTSPNVSHVAFSGQFPKLECLSPPATEKEIDIFGAEYADNTLNLAYAGDNYGPADPLFLKAMTLALSVPALTYQIGGKLLEHAHRVFQKEFAGEGSTDPVVTLFTPTGTSANRIGLSPVLRPIDAIIAADNSHLVTREAGAYHRINGVSAYVLSSKDGKLPYETVKTFLDECEQRRYWNQAGKSKPKVLSISQPTEYGTIYSDETVKKLAKLAHEKGMLLQMDGSRLFYVAAKTGKSLKALTTDLGVDIVSLGGSKNKMVLAEAVVYTPNFFKNASHYARRDDLLSELQAYAKQAGVSMGQSAPAAAQFIYALETGHAVHLASKAIQSARQLERILINIPEARVFVPTETNVVLMSLPVPILKKLRKKYKLMVFPGKDPEYPENRLVRFMTSASTRQADLEQLQKDINQIVLNTPLKKRSYPRI
jgi:threonine aldolase